MTKKDTEDSLSRMTASIYVMGYEVITNNGQDAITLYYALLNKVQ